jgi:endonuclease/exonuclease/phosphatase family metal-dependent hydrolase
MKLQTLNIWAGRVYEELIEHIREQSNVIDVFCFQEVYDSSELTYTRGDVWDGSTPLSQTHRARASVYRELADLLPQFQGIYHAAQDHTDHLGQVAEDLQYGLASFVRNTVEVNEIGELFVHQTKNGIVGTDFSTLPRNIQYIRIPYHQTVLTIVNFHGLWNGQGKGDSPARIEQSQKLKSFLHSCHGPVIVCGDFNLLPET